MDWVKVCLAMLLCAGLWGCDEGGQVEPPLQCPDGDVVAFEGEPFCIVIEDGFLESGCPEDFPNANEFRGAVVCSVGEVPEGLLVELKAQGVIDFPEPELTVVVFESAEPVNVDVPCTGSVDNFVSIVVNGQSMRGFRGCNLCSCRIEGRSIDDGCSGCVDDAICTNNPINISEGSSYRWQWDNIGLRFDDGGQPSSCPEGIFVDAEDEVSVVVCLPDCQEFPVNVGEENVVTLGL